MIKKIISQSLIYGFSALIVKILPFFLTPLLAIKFDPKEYAIFVNFYSGIGIISVLLTHGMETTIFRFSNLNYDKNKVISNAFYSVVVSGIIFLLLATIFDLELAIAFKTPNEVLFLKWFIWVLFFDALSAILFTKLRLEEKIKKFAWIKIMNSVLYFVLVLFFILFLREKNINLYKFDLGVGYTFLANLIASSITFFFLIGELTSINLTFNFLLYKKMILYSLPIMIAGLAGIINESIDRQLLKYFLPLNLSNLSIGIYGACYKFASIITLFKTAYMLGVEPFIFSNVNNVNSKEKYAILMKFFVIGMSLILLFILANISWIKLLLIPNRQYYLGISIVPIILIATVFLGIYLNLSIWYKINDQTYYGALISIIGSFITIFINCIFIPKFNFYASAIATLISYFIMMVFSYFCGQKKYPIPYNINKLIMYLGISIIFGLITFYFFHQNVWIGNCCLLFTFFIIYKKELPFIKKYIFNKKVK